MPPAVDTIPDFARGFVLTRQRPAWTPAAFIPRPDVIDHLWVDPRAHIDVARDTLGHVVVIIGLAFSLEGDIEISPSRRLMRAYRLGESRLLHALDDLVGRFVVIFGRRGHLHIVTDATAMRSTFYLSGGDAVASHAELAARAVKQPSERLNLPFRYGFPGNHTPISDVRIVTANTLLDWNSCRIRRFWPRKTLRATEVSDAADLLKVASTSALQRVAAGRQIRVALTAGLDSRTLLAVALHSGVPFEVYTYGSDTTTAVDRAVAASLAQLVGVKHSVIGTLQPQPALRARLEAANYSPHHQSAVTPLRAWFGDDPSVAVTANLLEIGRDFYKRPRWEDFAAPVSAPVMSRLHQRSMPRRARAAIEGYGASRYRSVSLPAFQSMIDDTSWQEAQARGVDAFDQFYWEHRMSTWHGPAMNERDYYSDAFIPFNYRPLFEAMLGVNLAKRQAGAVQLAAIESVDPGLLSIPINPSQWPAASIPNHHP